MHFFQKMHFFEFFFEKNHFGPKIFFLQKMIIFQEKWVSWVKKWFLGVFDPQNPFFSKKNFWIQIFFLMMLPHPAPLFTPTSRQIHTLHYNYSHIYQSSYCPGVYNKYVDSLIDSQSIWMLILPWPLIDSQSIWMLILPWSLIDSQSIWMLILPWSLIITSFVHINAGILNVTVLFLL